MEETLELTKEEILRISLGYKWYPEMSYSDFCASNSTVSEKDSYEVFNQIDYRYIAFMYEK